MPKQSPNVVIVGAGIIGAASAYYLAKAGSKVAVLDESNSRNSATLASFGWINSHNPDNANYFRLRMESQKLWRALSADYPDLPIQFPGSIDWDMDASSIDAEFNKYRQLDYECELVGRSQIENLSPHLKSPPELAIHKFDEGTADPQRIARAFIVLAKEHGAKFHDNTKVQAVEIGTNDKWKVLATEETFRADALLLCAGIKTPTLLRELGIRLPTDNKHGLLVSTSPLDIRIDKIISAPDFHFWQRTDGTLLAGRNQAGDMDSQSTDALLSSLTEKLSRYVPNGSKLEFDKVIKGTRPVPLDGMPVVGQIPMLGNLYVAMMHSGITLAPLIGSSLAFEIMSQSPNENLKPFCISRFNQHEKQSALGAKREMSA